MAVIDRLKENVVEGFRRLPPQATRRLPFRPLRTRALMFHNEVLRVHPVAFEAAPSSFGFALSGTTADLLQRNVYLFGTWELNLSLWVRAFLEPGDTVVDIGANVGYFSLLAATCTGTSGQVVAFEPVPSIVAALRANLELNGIENVTVQPLVASDEAGQTEIFRGDPGNLGLSATESGVGMASEGTVGKVRAQDVIPQETWAAVRLVKVDTEGDDLRALRGLVGVLRAMTGGSAAVVEITPKDLAARGQSAEELVDFMREVGFTEMLAIANSYEGADYARGVPEPPRAITSAPAAKTDVIFLKPS